MRRVLLIGTAIALALPTAAAAASEETALGNVPAAGPAVPVAAGTAALPVAWQDRYAGASGGYDEPTDIASDPTSGRVFVTGQSETAESATMLTRAYDADGELLWSVTAMGANVRPNALSVDSERGQIVISGTIGGSDGSSDLITIAYDLDGNQRWRVSYAERSGLSEVPLANGVDPETGTVYVTGYSEQNCCRFQTDVLTQAIDSDGDVLWTRRFGTAGQQEEGFALAVTPGGGVYVAGRESAGFSYVALTMAYDRRGQLRWEQQQEGEGYDVNRDIAVDPAGDRVYVTGTRNTTTAVVISLASSDGSMIWQRNLRAVQGGVSTGQQLAVDPDGRGVYATGTRQPIGLPLTPTQQFAAALTRTGAEVWQHTVPGGDSRDTIPVGIAIDPVTGTVYVAGSIDRNLTADDQDILVLGYDRNGRTVSGTRLDGGLGLDDEATAVAIDPTERRLYVSALAAAGERDDFDYLTVAFRLP